MKLEFLLFGVATAFSDCKGPRKHFKIGKLATIKCSHETKSCDITCEFGVKVRNWDSGIFVFPTVNFRMINHPQFNATMEVGIFQRRQRFFVINQHLPLQWQLALPRLVLLRHRKLPNPQKLSQIVEMSDKSIFFRKKCLWCVRAQSVHFHAIMVQRRFQVS